MRKENLIKLGIKLDEVHDLFYLKTKDKIIELSDPTLYSHGQNEITANVTELNQQCPEIYSKG